MQNSPESLVRVDDFGPVRVLTMTNPQRRNALSAQMMLQLRDALRETGTETGIAVVVVAAEGAVYSSGHDLREIGGAGQPDLDGLFALCCDLMETLQSIPQPVIAEVQGLATAAGCQLVAACDLAVAAETAQFATPGVRIGLFCSTPMVALTRAIGRKRAMEMLLTGRLVGAREAAEWGLVNRVVAAGDLRAAVLELAGQIASASSATVMTGKQAFYRQIEQPQQEAYRAMSAVMVENSQSPDAQEGICAFLEKRSAQWRGR